MTYGVILADPPWPFQVWSGKGNAKTPARHYSCMAMSEIAALPVAEVAARDAALLLWCTNPVLPDAIEVLRAWGFRYTSCVTWGKVMDGRVQFGTGYHLRGSSEQLLLGLRGRCRRPAVAPNSLFLAPRGRHSAKPDHQYTLAENYPGPYLEMFARPSLLPREGWTRIGNEITGRDIRDDLALLRDVDYIPDAGNMVAGLLGGVLR